LTYGVVPDSNTFIQFDVATFKDLAVCHELESIYHHESGYHKHFPELYAIKGCSDEEAKLPVAVFANQLSALLDQHSVVFDGSGVAIPPIKLQEICVSGK